MNIRNLLPLPLVLMGTVAMNSLAAPVPVPEARIERFDTALDAIVAPDAPIEKLASGFIWSEGPVWIDDGSYLLFTDVPGNTLYRWSGRDGLSVFLKPSGYTGTEQGIFREPGANGLFPDRAGTILMADHGNRQVARFDLKTKAKTPLATHFEGKRFNSPNDVTRRRDGLARTGHDPLPDPPDRRDRSGQADAATLQAPGPRPARATHPHPAGEDRLISRARPRPRPAGDRPAAGAGRRRARRPGRRPRPRGSRGTRPRSSRRRRRTRP